MTEISRRSLFGLLGAGLLAAAGVTAVGIDEAAAQPGPGPGRHPMKRRPPRPPMRHDRRSRRPSRHHHWVPGRWVWRGRWVWVVGFWAM